MIRPNRRRWRSIRNHRQNREVMPSPAVHTPVAQPEPQRLLSPKQAAAEIGCGTETIWRCFRGRLFPNAFQILETREICIPEGDVMAIKAKLVGNVRASQRRKKEGA
jgi:predicted DNA-binding transcriptional regulator AlpA